LDRPISRDYDFVKYKGSKVNIKTAIKIDGVKHFQGILTDFSDENGQKIVLVEVAGKAYRIPKKEIVKANLADNR
jgi:ribosome maturation factor RimP